MIVKKLFHVFRAEGDPGGAEVIDRGDDFTPTDDENIVADRLDVKTDDPKPGDKSAADLEAELAAAAETKKSALKGAADKTELTDEEKAAAAADDKTKKPDTRIPAARHKEILDKERVRREAVEVELAKYKQGTQIAATNAEITEAETKLVALEVKHATLTQEGKVSEAAAVMTDIRRTERGIITKSAEMRETAAIARAVETSRYDLTCDRLEALFPELDATHADFDKAKTGEVLEMKEAWEAKGYTPSQALQKAVGYVMPPKTAKQEAALEVEARVDTKKIEADRKAAAVKATAEALEKTPSSSSKTGKEHDAAGGGAVTAKDAIKMGHDEFIKLDETALARMRGDAL